MFWQEPHDLDNEGAVIPYQRRPPMPMGNGVQNNALAVNAAGWGLQNRNAVYDADIHDLSPLSKNDIRGVFREGEFLVPMRKHRSPDDSLLTRLHRA